MPFRDDEPAGGRGTTSVAAASYRAGMPTLTWVPALARPDLLAPATAAALTSWAAAVPEVADEVHVPDDWGCCAFAGDRGMLHPELTASATAREAANVAALPADAHASCNRTCELGMTRATGRQYRHVLELLAEVTRPGA